MENYVVPVPRASDFAFSAEVPARFRFVRRFVGGEPKEGELRALATGRDPIWCGLELRRFATAVEAERWLRIHWRA